MTYVVFFRPAGEYADWQWLTGPEGIEAATSGDAIRAAWARRGDLSLVGEWMAFPVEGSAVFGVEMTVHALRQNGQRVDA